MADNSTTYHEPFDLLKPSTRDMHRALVSLMEELEAIDWYQQRADACDDDELRAILLHNLREEIEHALMAMEWVRRHMPAFDRKARKYLFTSMPIVDIEKTSESDGDASGSDTTSNADGRSLGIGDNKQNEE